MTSTNTEETLILKTDALGRVRMPADRREAILNAFEQSGMSGQSFAEQIGVKYTTFTTWVQKRRRRREENPPPGELPGPVPLPITFVEAQMETTPAGSSQGVPEVETAEGVKLVIRSQEAAALAARLIRSLDKQSAC